MSRFRRAFSLIVVLLVVGFSLSPSQANLALAREQARPNIILILTDDLDAMPGSISHMPYLKRYLINQGATFDNAFVTTPLCCPSRATILRGQYSHNHRILTNKAPLGGFKRFKSLGREKSTVATWLDDGGYRTVHIGRYLNGYRRPYMPPGWDEWHPFGHVPDGTYHTDWLAHEAARFIRDTKGERRPFFMYLALKAPHAPADPAPRHADAFPNAKAPRPPSFNEEDVSDKPRWIREKPLLTSTQIHGIDKLYRKRLRSMLAVDEMIKRLVSNLRDSGKLRNTYIVFTSDNGFHMGQHRTPLGKGAPYEEDIQVPLIVRGPDVPKGKVLQHMVLNNDFAPTFADLAGAPTPEFVDGRSFRPLLTEDAPSLADWRSAFLVEEEANERLGRPRYKALRTEDHLWVEYANGERELYDLSEDPYQLRSLHETAPDDLKQTLSSRLDRLRDCARESCRSVEGF